MNKSLSESSIAHVVATSLAIFAQHIADFKDSNFFMVDLALLFVIATGYFILFYKSFKKIMRTPAFAVTNLLFIAFGTVLGTIVLQNADFKAYINYYGEFLTKVIFLFKLDDLFHSYFYVSYFILLVISLFLVANKRKYTKKNFAFQLTHFSLIIIILGGWFDYFYGMRGLIPMTVGKESDTANVFYMNTTKVKAQKKFDFKLRLETFETKKFEPDYKIQIWHKDKMTVAKSGPKLIAAFPIYENELNKIHTTDLKFRVKKYYKNHTYKYYLEDENIPPKDPILMGILNYEGKKNYFQLRSKYDGYRELLDPSDEMSAYFYWEIPKELEKSIKNNSLENKFSLVLQKDENLKKYDLLKEKKIVLDWKTTIEVKKIYKNIQFDEKTKKYFDQGNLHKNPAVLVHVEGKEDHFDMILFSNFNDLKSEQAKRFFALTKHNAFFRFSSKNRMIISGKNKEIYYPQNGKFIKYALEIGKKYEFPTDSAKFIQFEYLFADVEKVKSEFVEIPPEERSNPMVVLEVILPNGKKIEKSLTRANGNRENLLVIPGSDYFLALDSTKDIETKFWKSRIKIIENGAVMKEQVIEVNDPLTYKGYRFYQTDFDPKNPNYSGIGVTSEPGLYVIYGGFYLLVIGIFLMFYRDPKKKGPKNA
jgi:hypothetical protein